MTRAARLLLLVAAALFAWKVLAAPLWCWDHFAIWGLKARRMVAHGGLDLGFLAQPEFFYSRPDHPLGLPFAWILLSLGRPPGALVIKLTHLGLGAVLLGLLRDAARRLGAAAVVADLATAFVALSPLFWDTEAVGIAEMPLALLAVAAVAFAARGASDSRARWAAGLAAGSLPWIKQEGLPLAFLLLVAGAVVAPADARRAWRWPVGAAFALGAGAVLFQRLVLAPGASFFRGDWPGRVVARLPELGEAAGFAIGELLAPDWLGFWLLLAASTVVAAGRRRAPAPPLAAVVWVQLALYFFTCISSYMAPVAQLRAAFFRTAAALLPLGILAVLASWRPDPGTPCAGRPPVGP